MARPQPALPRTPRWSLLVRHGQTPTTGKLLPGRAPVCTSPTQGSSRRSGPPSASPRSTTVDAIYASPLERARETAAPIAARPAA